MGLRQLLCYEQSMLITEAIGYLRIQASATNNIGMVYLNLN
jgi:hypothetical protein